MASGDPGAVGEGEDADGPGDAPEAETAAAWPSELAAVPVAHPVATREAVSMRARLAE
ncbi:hypothetical protein LTH96_02825 [Nesterenkonia sp. LB17]|uniref:hypothetical protein n=1 Tax=unclassified Nesterenkonia TaxID=2629769 RepID=UPI001F4C9606|nr:MULTISPECIES: hypothetical protein [unclassified Nesterenkonia]MCH8561794.1 hypothetical protein [Nesterenkonia sp. YGD6]MCH8564677.1 hypothetical protein [Nesterenkonia sp. LB17]